MKKVKSLEWGQRSTRSNYGDGRSGRGRWRQLVTRYAVGAGAIIFLACAGSSRCAKGHEISLWSRTAIDTGQGVGIAGLDAGRACTGQNGVSQAGAIDRWHAGLGHGTEPRKVQRVAFGRERVG